MYKYFTQKDELFTSKRIKYYRLLIVLVMVSAGAFVIATVPSIMSKLFGLLFAVLSLAYLAAFAEQVQFNPSTHEIHISYFGLFKKTYNYSQFYNFLLVRHTMNGAYTGTSIKMIFTVDGKQKQREVYSQIYSTKNVQIVVEEIKRLMGNPV